MQKQVQQVQEVQGICRLQPIVVAPTASLAQVAHALKHSGQGFIPISINGKPQGLISAWDIANAISQGLDPFYNPARLVMQSLQVNPCIIDCRASLEEAAEKMKELQTRALCVVDEDGRLIGTLTLDQISQVSPELAGRVLQATAWEVPQVEPSPVLSSPVRSKVRVAI